MMKRLTYLLVISGEGDDSAGMGSGEGDDSAVGVDDDVESEIPRELKQKQREKEINQLTRRK